MQRCVFLVMILFLSTGWADSMQAQTTSGSSRSDRGEQGQGTSRHPRVRRYDFDIEKSAMRDLIGTGLQAPALPMVPLEETIDPMKYIVGPSDIFSVNVWIDIGFGSQPVVTPEGSLIIPTVGEVQVAGLTLAEAKQRVMNRVRKKYSTGDITVTLVSPRIFIVYVTGLVIYQGPYAVTATTRVDEAILLANLPTNKSDAKQGVVTSMPKNASQRNIVVRRRDGSNVNADLAMYYGTGHDVYNPTLLDGDVVFIPRKHTQENFVRVMGAVTLPDAYEFMEGDSLLDAIAIARGLSSLADSSHVELVRVDETATKSSSTIFDLRKVLAGLQPNVPLERGDRIVVHQLVVLNKDFIVGVWGEVQHPGRYPITNNSTSLSEAIQMAGGFTEHGFLQGGILVRQEGTYDFSGVSPDFEKLMYSRSEQAEPWDKTYFLLDAQLKKRMVNVDFVRLFNDHDQSQDVILRNNDHIYVPSLRKMTYVYGQVVNPGYVPWVEGMKYRYYIRKAGGFSDNANEGDTRIIKGRTLEWMKPDDTKVDLGDSIFVPSKEKRRFQWYVTTISQGAAIVGAILGSTALILELRK